jgi:hypothetical protein
MKIKAKFKLSSTIILSLGAIGASILGFYFLKPMFNHRYVQLVDLSFFLFSATVAISILYYLLKNEVITIDNNKLKQESFFGAIKKEYPISELNSYTAIRKENKYLQWEDLDLYFKTGKARITSSNLRLDNYYKLKDQLTNGLIENNRKKSRWENRNLRRFGIGFIVFWIVFSLIFIKQDKHGNIIVDSENTTQISGILQNKPSIKSGRKNSKSIEIYLVEYPNFKFKLNRPEIEALNADQFLSSVNEGDPISITLWKDTYSKKILESEELTFTDKHLDYHQIDILGLVKNGIEFMPKEKVNQVRSKFHTKGNFYGLMAFAVFGVGVGLYLITLSKKAR